MSLFFSVIILFFLRSLTNHPRTGVSLKNTRIAVKHTKFIFYMEPKKYIKDKKRKSTEGAFVTNSSPNTLPDKDVTMGTIDKNPPPVNQDHISSSVSPITHDNTNPWAHTNQNQGWNADKLNDDIPDMDDNEFDALLEETIYYFRRLGNCTSEIEEVIQQFAKFGPISSNACYIKSPKSGNIAFIAFKDENGWKRSGDYVGNLGTVNIEDSLIFTVDTFYRIFIKTTSKFNPNRSTMEYIHGKKIESFAHNVLKQYMTVYLKNAEDFFFFLFNNDLELPGIPSTPTRISADNLTLPDADTSVKAYGRVIPSLCATNDKDFVRIWARNLPESNLNAARFFSLIKKTLNFAIDPIYANNSKSRQNRNTNACFAWYKISSEPNSDARSLIGRKLRAKNKEILLDRDIFKSKA
jgi:hypothetical protein